MKERLFIAIAAFATLLCITSLFYVMYLFNNTRITLQNDGIDIFNYTMQNDRNSDAFAHALNDYRLARDSGDLQDTKSEYIKRYDVLWSAFRVIRDGWLGTHADLPQTQEVINQGLALVNNYEDVMLADVELTDQQIRDAELNARALSDAVSDLGAMQYQSASRLRDDISARMDGLIRAFWILGISLVGSTLALFALLTRATRRASRLADDARSVQQQLSKALDELQSGDIARKSQNQFLAAASHDLRQPLHALGLYVSALEKHVTSEPGNVILHNVTRSTEALNQLLSSLLDISKLDAGVVEPNRQTFNLDELFEYLHQAFAPDAQDRNLALVVHLSNLHVYTDWVLLERTLRNLISNAINYTPTGSVTLSAERVAGHVRVSVSDTGSGIPEIEQKAIFNEYYQLENPERDRAKGLGLGLSIVQRLTRMLDIKLAISSKVGAGTRFDLEVPLGEAIEADANSVTSREISRSLELPQLTILVIDDEQDVREGMRALLTQNGCEVLLADSADSATELLIEADVVPDLVIVDYRLRDGRTGVDAIRRVREEVNLDVPAMIITGDTSPERLREATASGFRLLHKPVVSDELFLSIKYLLQG